MISIFKLKLVDYFDGLINEIDLRAEELLVENNKSSGPCKDKINSFRNSLISKIKEIESFNLSKIQNAHTPEFSQSCFVIYNKEFEFLSESELVDGNFAYLIITDRHFTPENVTVYKNLLGFYNSFNGIEFERLFRFKNKVSLL
jgi:hypothetical protein